MYACFMKTMQAIYSDDAVYYTSQELLNTMDSSLMCMRNAVR